MKFLSLSLALLPVLAIAAPSPLEVSITINEVEAPKTQEVIASLPEAIPTYDESRIAHFPDKTLLKRCREFFKTFTTGDFDGMRDLQSENYTMTDIPIAAIRQSRASWYEINKQFVSLMEDLKVIALTIDGSSRPGKFSILEHVVFFKLIKDVPPPALDNLPVGAKPGDVVGMINISVLYWDHQGKITKELEYGRLTWKNFDVGEFDVHTAKELKGHTEKYLSGEEL